MARSLMDGAVSEEKYNEVKDEVEFLRGKLEEISVLVAKVKGILDNIV